MDATACAPGDVKPVIGKFKHEWKKHRANVRKLQTRIVKAQQEGKYNKVKALQWILTHSFSAKVLAIKRVTENRGKNTPGIDGVLWKTDKQKDEAVNDLKRTGYAAQPLRRVFIPKKKKKKKKRQKEAFGDTDHEGQGYAGITPDGARSSGRNNTRL